MYCSENMLWKDKEKSRIRVVQMDNLICLLGIRMNNGVVRSDEGDRLKLDKDVLRQLGHVEEMEKDRIAKRVYVGECHISKEMD